MVPPPITKGIKYKNNRPKPRHFIGVAHRLNYNNSLLLLSLWCSLKREEFYLNLNLSKKQKSEFAKFQLRLQST